MGTHDDYTRLLGLALRGGNLVTGSDAVQGAAYAGTVRLLLLSADASARTCRDAQAWAERGNCLLVALPCDKAELGAALGRGSVAVAALTDTGLAAAVGERLALYDSERYGAIAERLRLKSKRAAERRTARARARPDAKRGETAPRKREKPPLALRDISPKGGDANLSGVATKALPHGEAPGGGKRPNVTPPRKSGATRADRGKPSLTEKVGAKRREGIPPPRKREKSGPPVRGQSAAKRPRRK